MYLEWLYTDQVVLLDRTRGRGAILVQMYLLGDFLIDDRFCNAVIEILIRGSGATDPLLLFSFEDVDSIWSVTTPGSRLRTDSADLIVRDLSGDRGAPYFKRRGTWGHDVAVEVLARMAEFKLAALKIFAAIEDSTETLETIKSAVGHPKDNKNKCADYHKHDERYSRCTQLQGYFTSLYCVNECHRLATCTLLA